MPVYFTLAEARAVLPAVGRLLREAVQARSRYQAAEQYLQDLSQRILMQGGITLDTPTVEGWKAQYEAGGNQLKAALAKIEDIGVLVKDLDTGLVDFPALYRGEEVYLCWRMDEDDIGYWHGVNDGFAGRRVIDAEFLANHCGTDLV